VGSRWSAQYNTFFNSPLGYFQYASVSTAGTIVGSSLSRFCNVELTDAARRADAAGLRYFIKQFSAASRAWEGYAVPDQFSNGITNGSAGIAMMSWPVATPYNNGSIQHPNLETNTLWQSVDNDYDQRLPYLANDYGTNVGSAWIKPMSNGRYAVYIQSEGTVSTNLTATIPSSLTYSGIDVWSGTNVGIFTGSASATLSNSNSVFWILSPSQGVPSTLSGTTPALISSFTNSIYITNNAGQVYRVPVY
jgi:hypothetical protein